MYKKITHLENLAIDVFKAFAPVIATQTWFNGIELKPKPALQENRKPRTCDEREAVVYQGKGIPSQRLEITFMYHEDHDWQPISVRFITYSGGLTKIWHFRVAVTFADKYFFYPPSEDLGSFWRLAESEQKKRILAHMAL